MSLGSSFFNTLLKSSLEKDNNPENAIKLVRLEAQQPFRQRP